MPDPTRDPDATQLLRRMINKALAVKGLYLETLAEAFIGEVGCSPSEAELVQVSEGATIRWYFRRRHE